MQDSKQVFCPQSPSGQFEFDLARPYHRALLRRLYKTSERFRIRPSISFGQLKSSIGYQHPHKNRGTWNLATGGDLTVSFQVDGIGRASHDERSCVLLSKVATGMTVSGCSRVPHSFRQCASLERSGVKKPQTHLAGNESLEGARFSSFDSYLAQYTRNRRVKPALHKARCEIGCISCTHVFDSSNV